MIPTILFAAYSCDIFGIVCIVIVLSPSYTMWMAQLVLRKWFLGFKGEFINNLNDLHTFLRLDSKDTEAPNPTEEKKKNKLNLRKWSISLSHCWQESVWTRVPPRSPPDSSLRLTEMSLSDISSTSHHVVRPFHSRLFPLKINVFRSSAPTGTKPSGRRGQKVSKRTSHRHHPPPKEHECLHYCFFSGEVSSSLRRKVLTMWLCREFFCPTLHPFYWKTLQHIRKTMANWPEHSSCLTIVLIPAVKTPQTMVGRMKVEHSSNRAC